MEIEEYHIHTYIVSSVSVGWINKVPLWEAQEIPTLQRISVPTYLRSARACSRDLTLVLNLSLNSSPQGTVKIFASYAGLICDKMKIFPAERAFATFQGFYHRLRERERFI